MGFQVIFFESLKSIRLFRALCFFGFLVRMGVSGMEERVFWGSRVGGVTQEEVIVDGNSCWYFLASGYLVIQTPSEEVLRVVFKGLSTFSGGSWMIRGLGDVSLLVHFTS